jgi:hypothetical protein
MVKLDYACHELEAKTHLKEVVELLNRKKFGEAAGKVEFVIVELRMMKAAINSHIQE